MKKIGLLILLLIITGCKINTVECNKKETINEIEMNKKIIAELKTNKIINMKISFGTIIPEKYINQKDILLDTLKKQYQQLEEEYNIKPEIIEQESEIKIEFEMKEEKIKDFYNSKSTITTTKEIIKEFENQGYICEKK